jgi:hypothetical protein
MPYNKEVIFQTMEDAVEYYKSLGFDLTKDNRLRLKFITEVEIQLKRIGPKMYRSHIIKKITPLEI